MPQGTKSVPYIAVLEQGLANQHDTITFPRGEVQILSQLSSQVEGADAAQMTFDASYMEYLKKAENAGLVTLNERQQAALDTIRNMGARFISVTPTETLIKLQAQDKSNQRWVAVQVGTMKVTEILKEEEYAPRGRKPGEEIRLVLGRVRDIPTTQAKPLASFRFEVTTEPQELKFRAILQFNPFANSYTYIISDVGKPEESAWHSNWIEKWTNGHF